MTRTTHHTRRLAAGTLLFALVTSLAGCDRSSVITAGSTKVSAADLTAYLQRRGGPEAGDVRAALDAIGTRALLAEAARRADLDEDPPVAARIAASRREILAQAFLDRELAGAEREDLLRKRYDEKRAELTRRRVHVAHVAFHVRAAEPRARDEAESRATRAYARLAGGEPFEEVARAMSEDPVTAPRGGELGQILEGEVDAAFFAAAVALRPGEYSPPVETPFGFHLVKALEPVQEVTPAFEAVRARLAADARNEAEAALLATLRQKIRVTVRPERAEAPAGAPVSGKEAP